MSPTAHVPVVATTVAVRVDDRVRAYVEVELATASLDRVMAAGRDPRIGLAVVTGTGVTVAETGRHGPFAGRPRQGLAGVGNWRVAASRVPQAAQRGEQIEGAAVAGRQPADLVEGRPDVPLSVTVATTAGRMTTEMRPVLPGRRTLM